MKNLIFIGGIGKPDEIIGGELTKNQNILTVIKKSRRNAYVVDTHGIRRHPMRFISMLFILLRYRNLPILVSTNLSNVYWLFRILSIFDSKRVVSFIGTGGSFSQKVLEGKFKAKYLKFLHIIMVQGKKMQDELAKAGLTNHALLVNSKIINYIPTLSMKGRIDDKIRFVFLSRMHKEKGVDMILNCCRKLNEKGYAQRYTMTFFGGFHKDEQHKNIVLPIINSLPNVEYKGILNLRCNAGYDELANYDVMLFPTFWRGEGFPGVAIDAMIAGLPIIISDWNFNSDIVVADETGFVIPAKDENALLKQMLRTLNNPLKYRNMKRKCQMHALRYNTFDVFNESLFCQLGI